MAAENVEVELKYEVADLASADRYLVAPEIGPFRPTGPVRSTQVEDRYVDASDWALARAGFAARLRRTSKGTRVSLKKRAREGVGSLHRREELEGPADLARVPAEWPSSAARSVILELCGDAPLVELLTIRQLRRIRQLEAGETRAELSLDEVEVIEESGVLDRFEELEVELTAGDEAQLHALAAVLDRDPALRPAADSKLERAAAALRDALPGLRDELQVRWLNAPLGLLSTLDARADDGAAGDGSGDRGETAGGATAGRARVGRARSASGGAGGAGGPGGADHVAAGDPAAGGRTRRVPERSEPPAPRPEPPAGPDVTRQAGVRSDPSTSPRQPRRPGVVDAGTGTPSGNGRARRTGAAAGQAGLRATAARSIGIVADDSLTEAARKVLRFHFGRMLAREGGTRDGGDPEDLHDMRVATRRMRAAWRIFDDAFRPGPTRRLRRRLRTLAGRLGTVRDLDVLIGGLEEYRAGLDEEQRPGLEPLLALWRRQRDAARALLIEELDSVEYTRFVEEMEVFLAGGGKAAAAVATPTTPHRVRDRAPSRVWAGYEAVRAYESVLPWADVETLHDLRIATKWLRYGLEFFRETLGPDSLLLIGRVAALQEYLGTLHDADVASKLARDVLVAHNGELSQLETDVIGAYLHSRERELARRRRGLGPVWRAVAGAPFRRALGRATAAL